MNLFCCSVAVVVSGCRHVSSHLLVFFFFFMDNRNVEMLVNAGQELDIFFALVILLCELEMISILLHSFTVV